MKSQNQIEKMEKQAGTVIEKQAETVIEKKAGIGNGIENLIVKKTVNGRKNEMLIGKKKDKGKRRRKKKEKNGNWHAKKNEIEKKKEKGLKLYSILNKFINERIYFIFIMILNSLIV